MAEPTMELAGLALEPVASTRRHADVVQVRLSASLEAQPLRTKGWRSLP